MSVSGKCVKRRVFNMADEGIGKQSTQILQNQNKKKKGDNAAVCVVICSGCIGTRMAKSHRKHYIQFLTYNYKL